MSVNPTLAGQAANLPPEVQNIMYQQSAGDYDYIATPIIRNSTISAQGGSGSSKWRKCYDTTGVVPDSEKKHCTLYLNPGEVNSIPGGVGLIANYRNQRNIDYNRTFNNDYGADLFYPDMSY